MAGLGDLMVPRILPTNSPAVPRCAMLDCMYRNVVIDGSLHVEQTYKIQYKSSTVKYKSIVRINFRRKV